MKPASPHLLLLGTPFLGLDVLGRAAARTPGFAWLGELSLFDCATVGEWQAVQRRSQEPLPADLARLLPAGADTPGLGWRAGWSTAQWLAEMVAALGDARAVLVETQGAFRPETLARWRDSGLNLRFVHVVDDPAEFVAAASHALAGRVFIAPEYRNHVGKYPDVEPQLAWYRIHANVDRMLQAVPTDRRTRLPLSALRAVAHDPPALTRLLLGEEPASARPLPAPAPVQLHAEVVDLARRLAA